MTTSGQAPLERTLTASVPAVGALADEDTLVGEAPFPGLVAAVRYVPEAAVDGTGLTAPDGRTVRLRNAGQAGAGVADLATAFQGTAGPVWAARDAVALTLAGGAGALVVAAGDVLYWRSEHAGTTGLADPGGMVEVVIARD